MPALHPQVKPGGVTFPIFNGNALQIQALEVSNKRTRIIIQFDFAALYSLYGADPTQSIYQTTDAAGNKYMAFIFDPFSTFPHAIPSAFRSISGSVDFAPNLNHLGPYTPVVVSDSGTADISYLGVTHYSTTLQGAKLTFAKNIQSTPQSSFLFSKRFEGGNAYVHGAGAVIMDTDTVQPYNGQSLL